MSTERDRGLGLVEVIVAVVLLGVVTSAVLAIVLQAQATTVNNRSRVAASNLAAREIDYVREQFMATDAGPLQVANAGTVVNPHSFGAAGTPLIVDGQSYTVKRSVAWNVTGTGSSACEGGSLVQHPTLNVRVEVTWPSMGQTKPVVNTTNLAPPKGAGLPTNRSYIAVKVLDADGQPNPGRSVTVFRTSGGESRMGTTDQSGCAVVQVSPNASGTSYSMRLGDAGYVDISGNSAPERLIGMVSQGQLNSSVDISYDRAASLRITLVGGGVLDADVAGSSVSLYQSEYTGSSAITAHTVSGVTTTISGLWPTEYGAFLGTTAPSTFSTVDIRPGVTAALEVPVTLGTFTLSAVPAGASVIAAPQTATSCTDPGARPVDPAAGALMPGTWVFFAQSDSFGCSPGPGPVQVTDGDNGDVPWMPSTLTITAAPEGGGPIWAVSNARVAGTCTVPEPATEAFLVGEAPTGTVALPAGDWYVFTTPAAGVGPAQGQPCASTGLVRVLYGTDTIFAWTGPSGEQP
ncbi:hypothetical protein [Sanguibacter suaedae]|uniref:Prepilin-type N-terminal cleavage/methylation domain-containing protein n=1 Tax=Sanguibacter suaedae TaxID=2795737 RepID=A0A934I927_9MICO|nr:hypothetical protein [Sanguibacter suaedae]MBI9115352.1 hypothetical protein [Sanguibacter suaedae]